MASDAEEAHSAGEPLSARKLEAIDKFVGHYNQRRYHESLKNLTPKGVYIAHGQILLLERERIKKRTFKIRRLQHARPAA